MNTLRDNDADAPPADGRADVLRSAMVEQMREEGWVRGGDVIEALLRVPRHLFAPGTPLETVYGAENVVITKRDDNGDGGRIMEVGVIGHGNAGAELTDRVAEEVRTWSEHHRNRTVQFEIPPAGTDASDPRTGRFFLDRPHHPFTVSWR